MQIHCSSFYNSHSNPLSKFSTLILIWGILLLPGDTLQVSEYSFNPMKYYDDKFEAYNLLKIKPRTLGESMFFSKPEKTFLKFMENEPIFQIPQAPLESPFENYYSNFHSLLTLNSKSAKAKNDSLKGHPRKRELLKLHGMDLESLSFRNPKTGREYNLREIFDSKRMDPLYNLVHRLESPEFHLFLEKEKMEFAENSGLKEALLSQVEFQSLDQSKEEGNSDQPTPSRS